MNWKLDDISFHSYGVYVAKHKGLLDLPNINIPTFDWLDEEGLDYWQDDSDYKDKDKDIRLNCLIMAGNLADFESKRDTFLNVITASGLRELNCDYLSSPLEVYLKHAVNIKRLSAYSDTKQLGTFALRFTAPGDPDFLEVNIERWTGSETITAATVFTNNLKVNKSLQSDMYATCSFESNSKLDLKYFDYIDITSNGGNEDRFFLESDPEFNKKSTNKYQYSLRFEHHSNWLSHSPFLNDRNEGEFDYFANLDEIVDLILTNHAREYPAVKFLKGSIVTTEKRNHSFSAESCQDVLRRLCKEYEVEYEFVFDNYTYYQYTLNIASQVANDTAITLQYGKGNGLYELTRGAMLKNELCTVLFAFGAAKNLKPDYRSGIGRLSFTGNPLKNNDDVYTGYGPHGKVIYFDEIYPNRSATVTAYEQQLPEDETMTDAELYANPQGIYKITDSTIDFDINNYLLDGLTAKIRMKSGDLAGYEFEILRYEHDTKDIFIIPFKNEKGYIVPNDTLTIQVNDEYTLVDIDQPTSYVTTAETELYNAAATHLAEFSVPKYPFTVNTDPAFIDGISSGFEVGDRATIIDTDYGINGLFRIQNLTYDVYRKKYELTLLDLAYLSRRAQVELRLNEIEREMRRTRRGSTEHIRKNVETTAELRARLLDPYDNNIRADQRLRNESVDPRHLAYDATGLLWSLKGALLIENYLNDEDKIKFESGTLILHNWADNTLSRREIIVLRAGGGDYDPSRSWTVPETIITLATKNEYFIYAKVPLDSVETSCTIEVSETPVDIKRYISTGFLMYPLGTISAGEE